jgi:hypothetical protein
VSYIVQRSKRITINTDPQRRCYDGVNFSETSYWDNWKNMVQWETEQQAQACAQAYKNEPEHGCRYRVVEAS